MSSFAEDESEWYPFCLSLQELSAIFLLTVGIHNVRLVPDRSDSTNPSLDVHVGLGKKYSSPSHGRDAPTIFDGIVLHDCLLYVVSLLLPCGIHRFFCALRIGEAAGSRQVVQRCLMGPV